MDWRAGRRLCFVHEGRSRLPPGSPGSMFNEDTGGPTTTAAPTYATLDSLRGVPADIISTAPRVLRRLPRRGVERAPPSTYERVATSGAAATRSANASRSCPVYKATPGLTPLRTRRVRPAAERALQQAAAPSRFPSVEAALRRRARRDIRRAKFSFAIGRIGFSDDSTTDEE